MSQQIITIDLNNVNAYLIKENDKFLLIDTGGPMMLDKGYNERKVELESALLSNGCTKENLKLIILTHGDIDHCYNSAYLSKNTRLQLPCI